MRFLKWLDDIAITIKLAALGGLMLIALAVPSYYYYQSSAQSLDIASKGLQGVELAQEIVSLKKIVAEHRGLSARFLNGDASASSDLVSKGADVDQLFSVAQQNMSRRSNSKSLLATMQDTLNKWSGIRASLGQNNMTAATSFSAHSDLLYTLDTVIDGVLREFKLTQTDKVVNYHLIIANFKNLPKLTDSLGKLRGKGAGMLASQNPSQRDVQAIRNFMVAAEYPQTDFFQNLSAAAISDANYGDINRQIETLKREIQQAFTLAQNNLLDSSLTATATSEQYFDAYSNLIDGLYAYQNELVSRLDQSLQREHSEKISEEITALVVIIVVVVLIILLFLVIGRSMSTGIGSMLRELGKLENGDYSEKQSNQIRHDEIGKIASAVESLRQQLYQKQQEALEAARVKQAMDNSSTCFMIADVDHNICYMNKAVKELLADAEQAIKKDLPQFDLSNLNGQSIDTFHKNPKHQRGILKNLKDTHSAQISLGGYVFKLVLNPIRDKDGNPLGHSVEWHDMTDIIDEQRKTTRILESLDCTSTNVMIADADRKIIYMNRSVTTMLKEAESDLRKALPHFDVDKVVGSNMDIFHKNPSHQSTLLENLKHTYEAQIVVGKRHFRLVANPIFDRDGSRLGSVVEWLDRTSEVEAEQEITQLVEAAVRGDFSERAATEEKEGFLLMLAEGLNKLLAITESGLQEISVVLMAISKGDLTKRIDTDYQGLFDQLKQYCNTTNSNLANIIGDIRRACETIESASSEIAQGNSDLSSRTEQQASNLEETASSMEQLTSTVQQNADNAKQANGLASDAAKVAQSGGQLISEVVGTMGAINDSAQKIEDIIGVIDGIAFQTNILALNAAVEAARAGEQGRGFAVVASEVRTLAQRSANAAKDIKELISDSVQKVESGNELVNQSGETMREIVTAIQRVNDIMSEIASASIQQASGIEEVNRAVTQMDEMTQQNAALVEEAAAAAESLSTQAEQLTGRVNTFTLSEQDVTEVTEQPVKALQAPKSSAPKGKIAPPNTPDDDDDWESF